MSQLLFGVMGDPISHSLSPQIHQLFAAQFDIQLHYEKIQVPRGQLKHALQMFREKGGRGANVTAPLKEEAFLICQAENSARLAQAVNTLYWNQSNELRGTNTDGLGLCQDLLVNLEWALDGKRILICGAGGATAGILEPLLSHQPVEIVIANRDMTRAKTLVERFNDPALQMSAYEDLHVDFDLIINATSAHLSGASIPLDPNFLKGAACYDLGYSLTITPFCELAKTHGAKAVSDGLGMLIEQAALGFEIWHGVKPNTSRVRGILRSNA
ncbi:MAG: shikimate dehydrogenase [Gammaproteobacteria bacterium]